MSEGVNQSVHKAVTQAVRIRRALVATALIAIVAIGFAAQSSEWSLARELAMSRISGWVAVIGLAFGLSATPLSRLSQLSALSAWRRAIGISTAIAASVHVALSLSGPLDGAWEAVLTWPYLLAGGLAFLVLVLLFITSFPRVIRALRVRHWKVLHRLVYAAAAFVVAHLMLSPWGSVVFKGVVSGVLVVLLLSRVTRGRS